MGADIMNFFQIDQYQNPKVFFRSLVVSISIQFWDKAIQSRIRKDNGTRSKPAKREIVRYFSSQETSLTAGNESNRSRISEKTGRFVVHYMHGVTDMVV